MKLPACCAGNSSAAALVACQAGWHVVDAATRISHAPVVNPLPIFLKIALKAHWLTKLGLDEIVSFSFFFKLLCMI